MELEAEVEAQCGVPVLKMKTESALSILLSHSFRGLTTHDIPNAKQIFVQFLQCSSLLLCSWIDFNMYFASDRIIQTTRMEVTRTLAVHRSRMRLSSDTEW